MNARSCAPALHSVALCCRCTMLWVIAPRPFDRKPIVRPTRDQLALGLKGGVFAG